MTISKNSIVRLIKYKNVLYRFKFMGFKKVYSENLADALGLTAAQVRKDFSIFGIPGNRRGGYLVDELLEKVIHILGKNESHKVIIAGAGNIGSALMNYSGFERENIIISALFDIDPDRINRDNIVPVLPIEEMTEFVKKNEIKIGVITVTATFAQQVLEQMISAGIKGVINFAPVRLKAPDEIFINNIDIISEIEKVIYFVTSPLVAESE